MEAVSELNEMGCAEFADVTAELALGVLTGRERAEALAHLERCAACQKTVRHLTVTGEELLRLLPAAEPPPGFETRVLERLGIAARSPRPGPASRRTR
jgi:anti-sigma-K factor RskA